MLYGRVPYCGGMAKTDRVDLRLEPDDHVLIRRAADELRMSVSAFMAWAARQRAEDVLAERTFTVLPPEAWDALAARLDGPAVPKPEVAELFSRPDIFE